jgi:hypothetical protein
MDSTNRSPDDRAPVPDADPASSSMPAIPSALNRGLVAVARSQEVEVTDLMAGIDRLATSQRQAGALDALLRVARALKWAGPSHVEATLQALETGLDFVPAVLRSLDELADTYGASGERS